MALGYPLGGNGDSIREVMMSKIALGESGLFALVSPEDFDRVNARKWYARKSGSRTYADSIGVNNKIPMHRFILDAPKGMDVDHRDGDGLNNTRENLRLATRSENLGNARARADGKSPFKGVSWHRQAKRWQARVCVRGKRRRLGLFKNEADAARAYDRAAREGFGEFARLNGV